MRVGAVILARLGSSRLAGKVLRDVAGRPLLQRVLDRLEHVEGLDAAVVATSSLPVDEPLARWCAEREVACVRGPLDHVADRVLAAADAMEADAVARVNADSPWLDPVLLDRAIALLRRGEHDLVTNVLERSYPYGVSAEVFTVEALKTAMAASDDRADAEHVTRAFYARPDRFRIGNLRADPPYDTSLRLTVDTADDLRRTVALATALGPRAATAGTDEICRLARRAEEEPE